MEHKISREQWSELSKMLRDRVCAYFTIEQLSTIDEFIRLAGQAAQFDQVSQGNGEDQVEQFERLSRESKGDSRGWKFNRDEIQRKIR